MLGLEILLNMGSKFGVTNLPKKPFRAFPFIIVWGIWLSINLVIFDNKVIPQIQCAI